MRSAQEKPQNGHDRRQPWILIAEDDGEFRTLIAQELRAAGYGVAEAANGGEMLDYIARSVLPNGDCPRPDLVVADVRMPGLSGFDVILGLKAARYELPVIFMTAFGSAELHEHADDLGAVGIFDKPFELEDLLQVIKGTLSHR
jgi:DNA-binding response OmpR family regulator